MYIMYVYVHGWLLSVVYVKSSYVGERGGGHGGGGHGGGHGGGGGGSGAKEHTIGARIGVE